MQQGRLALFHYFGVAKIVPTEENIYKLLIIIKL